MFAANIVYKLMIMFAIQIIYSLFDMGFNQLMVVILMNSEINRFAREDCS